MMIQVKILSKSLIKPSTPTPRNLQNFKLSFFDQVADRVHLPLVLFYPNNPNCNNNNMEQQLEESLSRILTHVYPLAGRFTEDESSILCSDQGVTFIKARANCQLNDFLQHARKDLDLALSFWPEEIKNVDETSVLVTPVMIVQATKFQCGGLALSICTAHPAMDGFTCFKFVHEWARVCKLGIPTNDINLDMAFNLGTIFPARDLSVILEPHVDEGKRPKSKLIARRFIFDAFAISTLRDKIDSRVLGFRPSRVEMITALLWRSLIRASSASTGHLKKSIMAFPLNLRGKIDLFQVSASFGNLIIEIPIKFEPADYESKLELHHLVKLIRDAVQRTTSDCANATDPEEIVSVVVSLYKDCYAGMVWGGDSEVDNFTCSSLCRFPIQKTDFGWGNPISLMHFGSRHGQVFWLYDTECGTGIAVQMDLHENYMNLLQCDHDILTFAKF